MYKINVNVQLTISIAQKRKNQTALMEVDKALITVKYLV